MATRVQAPTPVITAGVTTANIVFASNVTAGNLLVCWLRMVSPQTVTDNLGDGVAWQRVTPYFGNNTPADKALWWKIAGVTGACTVTCSTGTSGTFRCAVAEYSGNSLTPLSSLPWELRAGGTTWNSSNGGFIKGNNGDLVIAGIGGATASDVISAGAAAPNSNLTKLDNNANGYVAIEDSTSWGGGSIVATFTLSVSGTPDGFVAVFGPNSPPHAFNPLPFLGPL